MQKWIMSANGNYFDHGKAFQKNGYIDWKQTRNFSVGDIVYIYVTKPESRIRYKTVVVAINMLHDETDDFSEYWIKKGAYKIEKRYFRLSLIEEYDKPELGFEYLKNYGMKYAPQSPCRVKEELEEYLNKMEVAK